MASTKDFAKAQRAYYDTKHVYTINTDIGQFLLWKVGSRKWRMELRFPGEATHRASWHPKTKKVAKDIIWATTGFYPVI